MGTTRGAITIVQLEARLAEMERELAVLRAESVMPSQDRVSSYAEQPPVRANRRALLRSAVSIAAATVGAGALLEEQRGTALATGAEGPTIFTSTTTTPAVQANNTGSGIGMVAVTGSGIGIVAITSSGIAAAIRAANTGVGPGIQVSSVGHGITASSSGGTSNALLGTSSTYTAIAGKTTSSSLTTAGVFGSGSVGVAGGTIGATTAPIQPVGVFGTGSNGSNLGNIGVQGQSDTNTGVYGISNSGWGVVGVNTGTTDRNGGVNGGSTDGLGVWGYSSSERGVLGQSTSNYGVAGYSVQNAGIVGQTQSTSAYGVWGIANGGYGVFCSGDFAATGTKSAVVPFPDGTHRQLYCLESPECWFEDFGTATLVHGTAVIPIDPDFAAAVNNDDYHVFLTAEGDSRGLYVSAKNPTAFMVREQQGGVSTARFSYRLVARRRDVEAPRLKKVTLEVGSALPSTLPQPKQ
jgi:hypothetical protein